ncbi:nucleotide sugar dehydrogenase [Listeria fleischmannii]|uniref:Nucleotide sugar dehydrogenase n=1 Tax=Listeria fleischmannii TaxID=1069827 RepID=A0A841YFB4_9LIST|nr:nucleotide sugar dehydrogenase [Listeria fleischmannii]EIA19362.1 nucleotide sugar dehydrogenase [Listeria fleischmannii subsp. coloradonensis]MBC1399075.1 nucleotide sugar dehydrogenase [Listeria fleischmannii]MBC1427328.1 nucleotide sugar dehydrogenase [Listeria fleischmannii]STY34576.1 UDP-glucose 6-dehydrogenase tuaD [Listeria fleischmannii subsp. coloradonensis]
METLLGTKEQQLQKFKERTAKIGVIGLGYVGLPLAIELADAGFEVVGIDIDESKVASLNEGKSHILDVPEERVAKAVKNHQFSATNEFAILGQLDAVSVCVPTPLNENQEPDISYMTFTAEKILTHMKNPLLILLESTTYPGTTRELFANRFEAAGKRVNEDYFLCFSPERVDPGNEHYQTKSIPKVIGGITEESSELAEALYGSVLDEIVLVSSPETAEMSKLLENTFRSVNIAFVNEMALMCERMGLDIWETIDAAATKPFGFMPFYPGPGVGGHCIPLDPMYLHWKGKQSKFFNKFIETAQEINMNMPYRVVDKIQDALDEQMKSLRGAKVLLMGAAYKADINDVRESPTLDVYEILAEYGVDVVVADPFVSSFRDNEGKMISVMDPKNCDFSVYDCAVVLTKHSTVNYEKLLDESHAIVDMRYIYRDNDSNKIFKIGGGK